MEKTKKTRGVNVVFAGESTSSCPLGGHRGRGGIPAVSPPLQVGEESADRVYEGGQGPEELGRRHGETETETCNMSED